MSNESDGADEWQAWADTRVSDGLDATPELTDAALRHVAKENELCGFECEDEIHNRALSWIRYEWPPDALGVDPEDDDITIHRRDYTEDDTNASVSGWEEIRFMYRESAGIGRYRTELFLQDQYDFITTSSDDELLIYDPDTGTYSTELSKFGLFSDIKRVYENIGHDMNGMKYCLD